MEEQIWKKFPAELFVNVAASLPFNSLLRCRTFSRTWNSIPLDRQFKELRPSLRREFMEHIREHIRRLIRSSSVSNIQEYHCTDGFLLMDLAGNIYVVQPSDILLTQVSGPDSNLSKRPYESYVVGMVVDRKTKNFTTYLLRSEYKWIMPSRICHRVMEFTNTKVYKYASTTGVWSLCGTEIDPCDHDVDLVGFVKHEGRYLTQLGFGDGFKLQCFDEKRHAWKTLKKSAEFQSFGMGLNGSLLFQHRGQTLLLLWSLKWCSLWELQGHELGCRLTDEFSIDISSSHDRMSPVYSGVR